MKFLRISVLLSVLCLQACADTIDQKPQQLLAEEKMADLLVDVRLLEGAYAGDFQRVDTSEYGIGAYYEQLFAKHGITRSVFLESNEYYALHPEALLRIETEVARKLDSLSAATPQ
jgi:Domain of unknown function (DUF4296)